AGASVRPLITHKSCTPPSGVPSAFCLNRTAKVGPFDWMKGGIWFRAPFLVATAICGFTAGLVPPTVGRAWHEAQLSELNRGPRPAATFSTSTKAFLP